MSQLPELEVLRKGLERDVVGKRVKEVWINGASLVPRHGSVSEFVGALVGHKIAGVSRRGVHLLFALDGDRVLLVRLGEHGALSRETAGEEAGAHTRFVATFTTGGSLHYVDPDDEGEFFVLPVADLPSLPALSSSGIDPLAETFTWRAFGEELVRRGGQLKGLLVDPTFVVGLGDLYSDEILWAAGLSGRRKAGSLSSQEVRRLYRALLEVLHDAVKQRTADGLPAVEEEDFDESEQGDWLKVWGREGQACLRCRQPISYDEIDEGVYSYLCPNCQT